MPLLLRSTVLLTSASDCVGEQHGLYRRLLSGDALLDAADPTSATKWLLCSNCPHYTIAVRILQTRHPSRVWSHPYLESPLERYCCCVWWRCWSPSYYTASMSAVCGRPQDPVRPVRIKSAGIASSLSVSSSSTTYTDQAILLRGRALAV